MYRAGMHTMPQEACDLRMLTTITPPPHRRTGGYFTPPIPEGDMLSRMKSADARLALGASKGNILASTEMYLPKEER